MNEKVDTYIARSTHWPEVMAALRPILLRSGLEEELKWGKPCYCHAGKNIVIMQEMKAFLPLMFFKGALLEDPERVLREQGPNSRSARRVELTSVDEVVALADVVSSLVEQAIAIEAASVEVASAPPPILIDELQARLDGDAALRTAFEALTPGRQREYNLHIAGAKKAQTREARIEKFVPKILAGKGLRD